MATTRTIPSIADVHEYLAGFTNYERTSDYRSGPGGLGTDRIEELMRRLGSPQANTPVLHITGTKGKGSVSHLTARLLQARGYRVGLFTSPHLQDVRERIMINGAPVPEALFCEAFARVQPVLEELRHHPTLKPPTYFETLTAMAFCVFEQARVGVIVLEVGMGGRLDATNISDMPVVASAITTVSLDHTAQLGPDLVSIAGEKAGILRRGSTLVLGTQTPEVKQCILNRAAELEVNVHQVNGDLSANLRPGTILTAPEAPQRLDFATWRALHHDVALPLLGDFQRNNAAVALGLAERFLEWLGDGPLDTTTIRRAWRSVHIPARQELLQRDPWVLLDGAHNAASAWALAETIEQRFAQTPRSLVFSACRDKDVRAMLRILAPLMDTVVLTTNGSPRCMEPHQIASWLKDDFDSVHVIPDLAPAMQEARHAVGSAGLVVVAGSLYLAGLARALLMNAPSGALSGK